uniref:Somatotropin n=1 Tax=Saimiri boliviensis boliviensis TaxID=39432 RepID=A0A2K6S0A0_SAIBB
MPSGFSLVSRTSLLLAFTVLCLPWLPEAGALTTMPLPSLYEYAVMRAHRLNQLAFDIYQKFEDARSPAEQNDFYCDNPKASLCSSASDPTPANTQEAPQKSDLELLRTSLLFIQLWLNPVQSLSSVFGNSQLNDTLNSFIYAYLKDLEEVIQTLIGVRVAPGVPNSGTPLGPHRAGGKQHCCSLFSSQALTQENSAYSSFPLVNPPALSLHLGRGREQCPSAWPLLLFLHFAEAGRWQPPDWGDAQADLQEI